MTTLPGQKTEPKGSSKKARLLKMETTMRELWEKEKLYESNAPAQYDEATRSKFMTTFPYPYMNGRLHLGHAFSATKCEFKNRYMRLQGRDTLFPFAFHCTGMPIVAAANKLKKELAGTEVTKPQTNILASMGIPAEEIPKFADPLYWLKYFPPKAYEDMKELGFSVDWRRSFITTEVNPYYDSFIRWQFNRLKAMNKLSFGKRHTVYSTIEQQPCADHDRQSGEGVMPQEYTLIKLQVLEPFPEPLKSFQGQKVFLVAATLRPETMYGQTNCFVLPDGQYGLFKMKNGDLFICSERSAKNMAYQELTAEDGKYPSLATIKGSELIGAALKAPLTKYEKVYALPMMTISMKKGTGVVTSCPSDAPDDWAALRDLQKKKELRAKFGIKDEWVVDYKPIPIIKTPTYGDMAALKLCEKLKIISQNDTEKLKEAKDAAYLKGFNEGVMTIGICEGEKVSVAKNKVRKYMVDNDMAVGYWEPSETVISRSGEECIVALCDQWCINYGESDWKEKVMSHVKSNDFTCYNETCYKMFLDTLDWLREWACSRTFGLGTKLPWDPQFLIESLSDSTIYNAYYTVSHLLQGGTLEGSTPGPLGIPAQDITEADWDYIFLHKPRAEPSKIDEEKLKILRREFEYWYPVDMRCSAKDLIKNHLTMMLYNHAAIWNESNKMMPRSFFCNGYIMVDGKKMSKQEGNFYTVSDITKMYGSDSPRLALALAGDLLEDANVEIDTIDKSILKIFTLEDWIEKQLALLPPSPLPAENPETLDLFDKIFYNDMIRLLEQTKEAYESMRFRDVVKYGFYEFQGIKDDYMVYKKNGKPSWRALLQYIEWQLIMMSPIIPHMADYCWRYVVLPKLKEVGEDKGKSENVIFAKFPEPTQKHDTVLGRISAYLQGIKRNMRLGLDKAAAGKKSGKGKPKTEKPKAKAEEAKKEEKKVDAPKEEEKAAPKKDKKAKKEKGPKEDAPKMSKCIVFVAKSYSDMQNKVLEVLNKMPLNEKNELQGDLVAALRPLFDKTTLKNAIKFGTFCAERAKEVGKEAFETVLPFDEKELLTKNMEFLALDIAVPVIEVYDITDPCPYDQFKESKKKATPGKPEIFFLPQQRIVSPILKIIALCSLMQTHNERRR
eukprot:TRINITY_DN559_c0_g1_i1.p1 TRINITY_DN559_c0_g1~~TRINITY_DN559_c0_g1_i1.p1  ORF type:complete len:1122 (+),score=167.37 TRINITY_DN559_c0_g1_i1:4398-7763(+)